LPRPGQRLAVPDLETSLGLRDRAMLELLYATGVRRAELANLAVFDLDVERRALMVREGKGRKDRMIPTGERAVVWCERYLAEARPKLVGQSDNGYLFLTVTGQKIYAENLSRHITSYVQRSGIGKPGSLPPLPPHDGDPDARRRRRHPLRAADARPLRHLKHPDLHSRLPARPGGGALRYASRRGE
jgi:integrase